MKLMIDRGGFCLHLACLLARGQAKHSGDQPWARFAAFVGRRTMYRGPGWGMGFRAQPVDGATPSSLQLMQCGGATLVPGFCALFLGVPSAKKASLVVHGFTPAWLPRSRAPSARACQPTRPCPLWGKTTEMCPILIAQRCQRTLGPLPSGRQARLQLISFTSQSLGLVFILSLILRGPRPGPSWLYFFIPWGLAKPFASV
ncbi:hypothetical protein BKA56DRAFT_155535 [Ilyonectria sp. MPI-CAGE-AT-0026]|nr:hypothetical protein BKA56DRAFT_155535 [Ilyonectria sp. MPI-CAGE-AT-0026]